MSDIEVVGMVVLCGDHEKAVAGWGGRAVAGVGGEAVAGDRGTAVAGDHGRAKAGDYGVASVGSFGVASVGRGGRCSAGVGGKLIFSGAHHMEFRVGNYGVKPDVLYRLDHSGLYLVCTRTLLVSICRRRKF